jgi:hypothetical protein
MTTKHLTKIGVLSLGKVFGAIYALIGLIFGAIMTLMSLVGSSMMGNNGAIAGMMFGVGAIIALPIFYGIIGFIFGMIMH